MCSFFQLTISIHNAMKRNICLILLAAVFHFPVIHAQQNNNSKKDPKASFEEFRKEVTGDFHLFRKKILADYDRFLDETWREFTAFSGIERNKHPKPVHIPKADPAQRNPIADTPVKPRPIVTPEVRQPHHPLPPAPPQTPVSTPIRAANTSFTFYCLSPVMPCIEWDGLPNGKERDDFARRWRYFEKHDIADRLLPSLRQHITEHQLNDWFALELIRACADAQLAAHTPQARISLAQYLLLHYGFDVRLAQTDTGKPILLVPFYQQVYARAFTKIDGQSFYLFFDSQEKNAEGNSRFYTHPLPQDAEAGRPVDLIIHRELKLPYQPHPYRLVYGNLKIEGEVNDNLQAMLYHYPQMPIPCYAASIINLQTRTDIISQVQKQLTALPELQAVNTLLQFIQHAFDYATDPEQHGFEKPYFFEELLLYPQCDCEDRSIFYSYLLHHALGVENHLVEYPGHECVAVHLKNEEGIHGICYEYENKKFYISDPTYIGAVTGECMPNYINESPKIELLP